MVTSLLPHVLFWLLAAVALIGGAYVVLVRDVMRMALGLGAFLLSIAGFFAYYGFGFLALAEVFVYVGGVLILILFAIMLVHRTGDGKPDLESNHSVLLAASVATFVGLVGVLLLPLSGRVGTAAGSLGPSGLAAALTGPLLVPFELAGALLLAALVAVVVIAGGEKR